MGHARPWMALALLLPAQAWGQSGFDAHGLYLGPMDGDARDPVTIRRPGRMVPGDVYAGGALEVLRGVPRLGGLSDVDGQVVLDLAAGYTFHERARLDLAGPLYFATTGDRTPDGPTLGDLRASAQILLVPPRLGERGGLGVGLVPWVTLPTGPADGELGQEGDLAGGLLANATWEWARVTLSGEAGLAFQPQDRRRPGRDQFEAALGLTWSVLERTSVGVEGRLYGRLVDDWDDAGLPTELLLSVRQTSERGPHVLAGAGFGVVEGMGVPDWRIFIGGGFGVRQDPDPDGDLMAGEDDACPEASEQFNRYHDRDGCPDELATLAVIPTIPGRDAQLGAAVEVTDGHRELSRADGPAVFADLVPYRGWRARAEHACWTGELEEIVLVPGRNLVGLPLERRLDAQLRFMVVDERGVPLEGARVQWLDDGPDCSPVERLALPAGIGSVRVGAGRHTVMVSAPGRVARTFRIGVPRGADEYVEIALGPPEVLVRDDAVVSRTPVHFERDGVDVLPTSAPLLEHLVRLVVEHPELGIVEIAPDGGGSTWDGLALRRAMTVRDHLVRGGVPAARVLVRGLDEASADDEAVWGARRVRLELPFRELPIAGEPAPRVES